MEAKDNHHRKSAFVTKKNLYYDRCFGELINKLSREYILGSVFIDCGSYIGEAIKYMPEDGVQIIAFEPISELASKIRSDYPNAAVYDYAISNINGNMAFIITKDLPKRSSLKSTKLHFDDMDIEERIVLVRTLDSLIPNNKRISFIKLDVEGAEYSALQGAVKIINRDNPIIVFEASPLTYNAFEISVLKIWNFFIGRQYKLFALGMDYNIPLSKTEFMKLYEARTEWNYVAMKSTTIFADLNG